MTDAWDRIGRRFEPPRKTLEAYRAGDECPSPTCRGRFRVTRASKEGAAGRLVCDGCGDDRGEIVPLRPISTCKTVSMLLGGVWVLKDGDDVYTLRGVRVKFGVDEDGERDAERPA